MRILMIIIGLFIVQANYTFAQNYFIASGDLKELSLQDVSNNTNNNFIYRLDNSKKFTFYAIALNPIMYESKYFFKIPNQYKEKMHKLPVFTNGKQLNEIIFNNNFILIDEDIPSISIHNGAKKITIKKSPTPETIIFTSKVEASIHNIENGEVKKIGEFPFIITSKMIQEEFLLLSPRSNDYGIKEVHIKTSGALFTRKNIEFKLAPSLKFNKIEFKIENESLNDDEKLLYLDSLSKEINSEIEKNKKIKNDFFSLFETKLYSYHDKVPFEKKSEYLMNKDAYDQYVANVGANILKSSGISIIQSSYKQKLELIENYKADLHNRVTNSKEHILDKIFFLELAGNIGKNMPYEASNPGPSMLLGGRAAIQFYHKMTNRLNGFARVSGHYSQWYFNERYDDVSTQLNIGLDYGVSFPFKPPFNIKNIVKYVDLNPFVTAGYSILKVENNEPYEEKKPYFGGGLGLDIRVSSFPVILGTEYSYYSNKFGDLMLLIKVPIFRMKN